MVKNCLLKTIVANVLCTRNEFPFGGAVTKTRAFLIQRPAGNVWVYGSSHVEEYLDHLAELGSVRYQLLNHRDEASKFCNVIQAPVFCHAMEKDAIEQRNCAVGQTYDGKEHSFGGNGDLIAYHTPGHARGVTSYLWKGDNTNSVTVLFTGDTLYANDKGKLAHGPLQYHAYEGNIEDMIRTLEFFIELNPTYIISGLTQRTRFREPAETRREDRVDLFPSCNQAHMQPSQSLWWNESKQAPTQSQAKHPQSKQQATMTNCSTTATKAVAAIVLLLLSSLSLAAHAHHHRTHSNVRHRHRKSQSAPTTAAHRRALQWEPTHGVVLELLDASNGAILAELSDGTSNVLDLHILPPKLTVGARGSSAQDDSSSPSAAAAIIAEVDFWWDGARVRTESVAPYTLAGEKANGDLRKFDGFVAGTAHNLTVAVAWWWLPDDNNANATTTTTRSIQLDVIDSSSPPPPATPASVTLILFDAATVQDLGALGETATTIDLNQLPVGTTELSVRAEIADFPDAAADVEFYWDGALVQTEREPPFTMSPPAASGGYRPVPELTQPQPGPHALQVVVLDENTGSAVGQVSANITIVGWVTPAPVAATAAPTVPPTAVPTVEPTTATPSSAPTPSSPSASPTVSPTTAVPSDVPSNAPTDPVTGFPSRGPSATPSTSSPSASPSVSPTTAVPSDVPSNAPNSVPSASPSVSPTTALPSDVPSSAPSSSEPSTSPTASPSTAFPSDVPSTAPTDAVATGFPSSVPSASPTASPSTAFPSDVPSSSPTDDAPSSEPSASATTEFPSDVPSSAPSASPSSEPSASATTATGFPSDVPSSAPSASPSSEPSASATTDSPSVVPSDSQSAAPTTRVPSESPSASPIGVVQYYLVNAGDPENDLPFVTFNRNKTESDPNMVVQGAGNFEVEMKSYRWAGNMMYKFTSLEPRRQHNITLGFVESYHCGGDGIGARIMNVTVNKKPFLGNFNVFEQAGGCNTAVFESGLFKANSNGILRLFFSASVDKPMVSLIKVEAV